MLNVCFGDVECGMLRVALNGERVTYGYTFLDNGKISPKSFKSSRRRFIKDFFDSLSIRERQKMRFNEHRRFKRIIKTAKKERNIRIWYASSPCSACGFYHIVYSLQGIDCRIFVVEMPKTAGFRAPECDRAWSEANPTEAYDCLKLERELSEKEKAEISQKWKKLAEENSALRLNIDGEVTSVSVDHLDSEILSYAPKEGEFKLGTLIGKTLGGCVHAVSDVFVAKRIEAMISDGVFVVIDRPKTPEDYYYGTVIKLIRRT